MKKIGIIGAGISGLFIANLFKENPNYQVTIFEKKNSVELEEGYGIQLSTNSCLLYTSPSPRDRQKSRMPSSA